MNSAPDPYVPPQVESTNSADDFVTARLSKLGLISVAIGIGAGCVSVASVVAAAYQETKAPGGESALGIAIGLAVVASVGMSLLGLGVSIAAMFQGNSRHLAAILGMIMNAMVILGLGGLAAVGMMVE